MHLGHSDWLHFSTLQSNWLQDVTCVEEDTTLVEVAKTCYELHTDIKVITGATISKSLKSLEQHGKGECLSLDTGASTPC